MEIAVHQELSDIRFLLLEGLVASELLGYLDEKFNSCIYTIIVANELLNIDVIMEAMANADAALRQHRFMDCATA